MRGQACVTGLVVVDVLEADKLVVLVDGREVPAGILGFGLALSSAVRAAAVGHGWVQTGSHSGNVADEGENF